jgi:predicted DNA binding protein
LVYLSTETKMRKVTLRLPTKAVTDLGFVNPRFFRHNERLEVLQTFGAEDAVSQVVRIRRRKALPDPSQIEGRREGLLTRYALRRFEVLDRDEDRREVTALITRTLADDLRTLLRELGSEVAPARPFVLGPEETIVTFYAADERLPLIYALLDDLRIPYEVASLRAFRGERGPLSELTERQRLLLQLAYRLGYYDTPSRTSLARLARIVGVSRAAVSKTLRRAQARLLAAVMRGAR